MTSLHREIIENLLQLGDQPAVMHGREGVLSYTDLSRWIANLQAFIADGGETIGILASRSPSAYVSILACFLAGKRFVPLNPEFPLARLKKVMRASGIDIILFDPKAEDHAKSLLDKTLNVAGFMTPSFEGTRLPTAAPVDESAICYQMFTSGSTGEPKGVPISYASLNHYIGAIRNVLKPTSGARFSQLFDLTFDLSMHDIFLCFASGGVLVPAGQMDILMPHRYIETKKIDYWFSVPLLALSAVNGLAGGEPGHKLSSAAFCGEALPESYARHFGVFLQEGAKLWNLYGPTEATIAFTACLYPSEGFETSTVPLGEPFGQNTIAIETEVGDIVDCTEGVEGELLLSGPQVFKGYEPAVGKACFADDTGRFYRSGDQVRFRSGLLEHLGRIDDQVKIRGFRIELGDIEAAFRDHFDCDTAVAVIIGEAEQAQIAVAYTRSEDIETLDAFYEVVPDYMLPKFAKRIESLPTNVNGKVDRRKIRDMIT